MKLRIFDGAALALLAVQLGGCGGSSTEEQPSAATSSAAIETATPTSSAPSSSTPSLAAPASAAPSAAPAETFSLTVADLAAYETGLRREIEVLRAARQRLRDAESDEARLEILGELQPQVLRREGAAAAGTAENRYAQVSAAVGDVLGKREMAAAAQQTAPSAADLEAMPAELRARVEENLRQMQAAWGDPYAGLDADTAEALQQRANDLAQLRAEHIGLLLQPQ